MHKTKKKMPTLKHCATHFPLAFVYLLFEIGHLKGSFGISHQILCEYEDAFLIWPNVPGNAKNKAVYKGDTLVMAWSQERGFSEGPSYEGRLKQQGESAFWIRKANRSDSGNYKFMYNSPTTDISEESLNLQVLELPQEDCGIPMSSPKWMNGTENCICSNISVLKFESGLVPGIYTACATGESMQCFLGDAHKLCSHYTVSEIQPQNQSSSMPDGIIAAIIVLVLIMMTAIVLVWWKKEYIRRKLCMSTIEMTVEYNPNEVDALMGEETSAEAPAEAILYNRSEKSAVVPEETSPKGVQVIKRYLINQYRTMTAVSLSPCYEENFEDVSKVYCDLDIISLGENVEGMEYINPTVASYKEILGSDDKTVGTADNVWPIPAVILGECGSGKSSWCKNVVKKWCEYHDNNEMNLKESDLGVPELAKFDVLLYIMLQNRGEGLSFLEYVRNTLFVNATEYFEYIISCNQEPMASILVLIDGFDEVTCNLEEESLNFLRENKQCSVVVTSRSSGLDCLQLKPLRIFQIQGMSPSRSREYAKKVLDILSERRVEKLNVDHFWKFAKNIQVLNMCHLPLLCLSLIMFWIESKALSVDLTDVLLTIIEYYLRRAMTREKYKNNICQVLEQQHFDISKFIAKTKHKQYLRDHGYLLKVISNVAEKLWYSQMQVSADKNSAEIEPSSKDNGIYVELCVETGILKKTFREKVEIKRTDITFSHPLLFDFFVASSIALEKQDSCTKCMTSTKTVVENSYMIHMLCQLAPNTGQEVIKGISELKLFNENNEKDMDTKRMLSDQKIICNIECKDPLLQGGAPVKWLQTLMYTGELSSAKLSILTEGLKFTKELTVFLLQVYENRNECIFRMPILSKLHALQVEVENCTLLLHEEREWSKEIFSELHTFVLKSVKIDVRTTGYIVEALGTCQDLLALELCPKDDADEQILTLGDQKAFLPWGCLAHGITHMKKLGIVRLYNLTIGRQLSTLIDSLCKCPNLEILDLLNLKEIDSDDMAKINTSDRILCDCMHHIVKSSKKGYNIPKTVLLTKNVMSENSWLVLSKRLETLSPSILHVDQVYQSGLVLNELFQGIGRCKNLTILSICCIHALNDSVEFSGLKALHKLRKLTLCKITLPDSSWKEMFTIIGKLTKLKEISLAHLEMKTCFIKVEKLLKLMILEMREIELEEALWTRFANKIMIVPELKKLQLISCKMSRKGYSHFYDTLKHSSFHVMNTQASTIEEGSMLSVNMVVRSDVSAS